MTKLEEVRTLLDKAVSLLDEIENPSTVETKVCTVYPIGLEAKSPLQQVMENQKGLTKSFNIAEEIAKKVRPAIIKQLF